MAFPKRTVAAFAAGLMLAAFAAGAQEPAEMPPADQPAEALPAPVEPPAPLPAPSTVSVDVLRQLARDADDVWRVAILSTERPVDGVAVRLGDRVALTQADFARRLDQLARSQGIALPGGPSPEAKQRVETLRTQPPGAFAGVLAALVRQSYPGMLRALEGWAEGPEHAVAEALLPPLREELALAERLGAPALSGSSGAVEGSASPQ
ncbi:hypothetical protein [Azospirillum sp. sgz301742]